MRSESGSKELHPYVVCMQIQSLRRAAMVHMGAHVGDSTDVPLSLALVTDRAS